MRRLSRYAPAAAATAIFAACVAYVFGGAWGLDAAPVMPDARTVWPCGAAGEFVKGWLADGKFAPLDLRHFAGSPYFWTELFYAVCAWLSGAGLAYWLRGRGVSRAVACAAGLFLSLCGYWFTLFSAGHGGWFCWMSTGVFAFGLIDRAVRKNKTKNWILLGACEAWACMRQPDLWLLFAAFAGAYFVWCCVRERKLPPVKGLALCAAAFFAIGAPGFASAVGGDLAARDRQIEESAGGAPDADARWNFATNWSLPPAETAEFAFSRINGDTSCPMTLALGSRQGTGVKRYTGALGRPYGAKDGNYRQHSLYVGIFTCALALFALAAALLRRQSPFRRETLFLFCAALVFWTFSLGRYCEPVYRLVYALPFGDYLRAPVKWHHLTELCLCALAGFGLETIYRAAAAKSRGVALAVVGFFAVAGAADLAKIDRLYCAVVDLAPFRAPNAAAHEAVRRGGGKLLDMAGGSAMFTDMFRIDGIEIASRPDDEDIRFVVAPAATANDGGVGAWLKSRGASMAGCYSFTRAGVRKTQPGGPAQLALWELPGAPKAKPSPVRSPLAIVLGSISLVASVGAAAYGAAKS